MIKTTILLERSTAKRLEMSDNRVDGFDINGGEKFIRKSKKSKNEKLFKLR